MSARLFFILVLGCHAAQGDAAAVATGRNWRLSIDSIECEAAESRIVIGTRIRYAGPKGVVEAPVSQLVDGNGQAYVPKSLVWRSGSKPLAAWLSTGGLRNIQEEYAGEIQWKFEPRGASGELKLEFGDIKAFSIGACGRLLRPDQIQAPRVSRAASAKPAVRVYRGRYPCTGGPSQTLEAQYPPYLPRQLLVFGRGYLPNARQIELPMGKAPAQSYAYGGLDELKAVENAALRAIATDFPEYGGGYFAFNWGAQRAQGGNEVYSIGIYDVRRCLK
jgi:hypothetical protein